MEIAGAHYSSSGFNTLEDVQFMSRQPSMVSGRRILEDVLRIVPVLRANQLCTPFRQNLI